MTDTAIIPTGTSLARCMRKVGRLEVHLPIPASVSPRRLSSPRKGSEPMRVQLWPVWPSLAVCALLCMPVYAVAQAPVGALAIDDRQGDQWGWAVDYATVAAAQERALQECGSGCSVVLTFGRCAAYAADQDADSTAVGWAEAYASGTDARQRALSECRSRGGGSGCTVRAWGCNGPVVEEGLGLDPATRRQIQLALRSAGFDPGGADGLFGPRTRAAIRNWQSSRGGRATGYLDGVAVEALRTAGGSRPAVAVQAPAAASADRIRTSLRRLGTMLGAADGTHLGESESETPGLRTPLRRLATVLVTKGGVRPGESVAQQRPSNAARDDTTPTESDLGPVPNQGERAAAEPDSIPLLGALAVGHDEDYPWVAAGWAVDQQNADLAREIALNDCRRKFRGREIQTECSAMTVFESCAAAAVSFDRGNFAYGWASGGDESSVREVALQECRSDGGTDCTTRITSRCNGSGGYCGLPLDTPTYIIVEADGRRGRPRSWLSCRPSMTGPNVSAGYMGCNAAWRTSDPSRGHRSARSYGGSPYCSITHEGTYNTKSLTIYRLPDTHPNDDTTVFGTKVQEIIQDWHGVPFSAPFTRQ